MNNPWNITMDIDFDENHKEKLVEFYEKISGCRTVKVKEKLKNANIPIESKEYLKNKYDEGYGLKVIARCLGLTYTKIRTLFRYLSIDHRKGRDIVTDKVREFRSMRVMGDRSPWKDWPKRYPEMLKDCSRGIQGYYRKKDNSFVYLRSSWEYVFAKWLDNHNIDWKYEYKQYKLSNGETYRPDFFIFKDGELKMIIEIKGYYKDREHKIDVFRKDYSDIKIVKISKISDYTPYSESKEKKEWLKERLLEKE
uniref:Putative capsid protein n=1 Tax=viral metagenome TaxID=1070528 RepID=A0A6M3JWQ5_9ZZZZ